MSDIISVENLAKVYADSTRVLDSLSIVAKDFYMELG
jgi:hypothetical protein